jgi:uncharacterized membrane protein
VSWTLVVALSAGAYLCKAAGVLALRGREVPEAVLRGVGLLPPALLAALVVVQTVGTDAGGLVVDARVAGMAAAGVAVWRRAPFLVVVAVAMATTAALRALS